MNPSEIIGEIPDLLTELDTEEDIWTHRTNAQNPKRVASIQKMVQIGDDLTPEQHEQVRDLISEFTDTFAATVKEVYLVDFKSFTLNIPPDMVFPTKVNQRPLTLPQRKFLYLRLNKLMESGIICRIAAEDVRAVGATVLAQKAH
ncbi:hypothetical protein PAXINDRAFT_88351, partial [Paxillus involutus ATCC 200175]